MNNRYGLDDQYFRKWMKRVLASGLEHYTPQELARELARMSKAAAPEVMHEPEFSIGDERALIQELATKLRADKALLIQEGSPMALRLAEAGIIYKEDL